MISMTSFRDDSFFFFFSQEMVSKPMPQEKKKVTPLVPPNPKGPKHNFVHTILESRSWRSGKKEEKQKSQDRQTGPEPWSKPPLIYPGHMMSHMLMRWIRWHIGTSLTFLGQTERRAVHPQSSGSRPLEGDRVIFRQPKNCVKTLCPMYQEWNSF